ncbi:unnamed protein product [Parnassius mnemosyne]|uniref:DDE Tnp4 domain-containing protein n=1 Tax=Parnassius mnemosyne TaxID=213953 RepID=A0AAV1LGN0_9NEOP
MKRKRRRYHVHPVIANRLLEGEFSTLFSKLRNYNEKFSDYFGMSVKSFDELLARIQDHIKHHNMFRIPVRPVERLAVTLRYLRTGQTFSDLHFSYQLGKSTICLIVREVCLTIWNVLHSECLSLPRFPEDWLKIASGFEQVANFPNCVGCLDGKHVRIVCPEKSGSLFLNYKKHFSINLLAMCDSEYRFTYIHVGSCGSDSDSTIFKNTSLYTKLHNGELNLPSAKPLPNTTEPMPYVLIGDGAFGISNKVLRPYVRSNMTHKKKIFNYRLSRARRYIESTFGIMSNKFKIFQRSINHSLPNAIKLVKTCCILHNYIRERDGYKFEDTLTIEGFQNNTNTNNISVVRSGDVLRDKFANYFVSEVGAIPWQDDSIF